MYSTIINPQTGQKYSVNSKLGKEIILNYLQQLIGGKASNGEEFPIIAAGDKLLEYIKTDELVSAELGSSKALVNLVRKMAKLIKACFAAKDETECIDPSTCWQYVLDNGSTMNELKIFYYWCCLLADAIMNSPKAQSIREYLRGLEFPGKKVQKLLNTLNEFIDWTSGLPEPPLADRSFASWRDGDFDLYEARSMPLLSDVELMAENEADDEVADEAEDEAEDEVADEVADEVESQLKQAFRAEDPKVGGAIAVHLARKGYISKCSALSMMIPELVVECALYFTVFVSW